MIGPVTRQSCGCVFRAFGPSSPVAALVLGYQIGYRSNVIPEARHAHPRSTRDRSSYWYERHETWQLLDVQELLAAQRRAEDERRQAEHPDDPSILFWRQ